MNFKSIFFIFIIGLSTFLKAQEKPNIVWIVSEDNSKHYMKLFDENGVSTPNIEKLAEKGIQFNRAFSNAAVCSAARSSIITGVYGPKLASHYHRSEEKVTLPENIKMFPEYLRDAGYYTSNNAKEDYNIFKNDNVWDDSSKKASWRNRNKNQPFFHVQNLGTTHEGSLHFTEASMESSKTKTEAETVFVQPNHPQTETFKYTNALYRDLIIKMDAQVAEVIEQLKDDHLLENTIVFYYGDHGGVLPNSKGYLKETGLHVPLVVYIPEKFKNLSPFTLGTATNTFVSFIDFSATVLNLAGIAIPKTIAGTPFLGTNISKATLQNNKTYGYADRFDEKYDMVRSLRKGNLKYIRNFQPFTVNALMNEYRYRQLAYKEWKDLFDTGKLNEIQFQFFTPKVPEELYDVENDPYETINLANNPAYQKSLKQLRKNLNSWMSSMPDLSLYPENYIIDKAFNDPITFGQAHKKEISNYLKIANLQIIPFKEAQPKLKKYLESTDDLERYWALITCSSFGTQADEFSDQIQQMMTSDSLLINRMRAAEYLGITGTLNSSKFLTEMLYSSTNEKEALLILNTITLQQDYYQKYQFNIDIKKLDKAVYQNSLIQERVTYLNN
ncbi:arylsulfatase A-like enzyme [Maribacter spongiicola]|uniref:Arylsulfatase A-like enzyme n=1 Tax=Maribacter spongiicola TaxID=1206753 RepID=A0A4R7K888_9FLAO|nr:sulfatase [Maribacter spongiicola]TDT47290.1 arylsulfatase A-like enzyme [Maribacter spongiicola]